MLGIHPGAENVSENHTGLLKPVWCVDFLNFSILGHVSLTKLRKTEWDRIPLFVLYRSTFSELLIIVSSGGQRNPEVRGFESRRFVPPPFCSRTSRDAGPWGRTGRRRRLHQVSKKCDCFSRLKLQQFAAKSFIEYDGAKQPLGIKIHCDY